MAELTWSEEIIERGQTGTYVQMICHLLPGYADFLN